MMAAASCSVGIIPFHRPCLPYLDLSSYSPASRSRRLSSSLTRINASSLALGSSISIQQVSDIGWKKNSSPRHRNFIRKTSSGNSALCHRCSHGIVPSFLFSHRLPRFAINIPLPVDAKRRRVQQNEYKRLRRFRRHARNRRVDRDATRKKLSGDARIRSRERFSWSGKGWRGAGRHRSKFFSFFLLLVDAASVMSSGSKPHTLP